MRFHWVGIARNERISAQEVATETQAPADLPREQIVTLLMIRAGDADSLAVKVLTYLQAIHPHTPTSFDFTKLREAGYVTFNGNARLHVLTPPGLWKVQELARDYAHRFSIHHLTFREGAGRGSYSGPSVSCSCGWGTHASRRNAMTVQRAAARHMENVRAGTWKRPRPVADFLNEVAPPKFEFNSGPTHASSSPASIGVASLSNPGAVVASVSAAAPGNPSQSEKTNVT